MKFGCSMAFLGSRIEYFVAKVEGLTLDIIVREGKGVNGRGKRGIEEKFTPLPRQKSKGKRSCSLCHTHHPTLWPRD